MLNGVSDSLHVQQRSQPLLAATVERHKDKTPTAPPVSTLSAHKLKVYAHWARVTQGQHNISASQVADHGIKQVMHLLKQLKKRVQDILTLTGEKRTAKINEASLLQARLAQVNIKYQNNPLLDHQLNLIYAERPSSPRQFILRSIELAQTKSRDERILIQIESNSIAITLPAKQSQYRLRDKLTKPLAELGITVEASQSATTVFSCDEACWQKIVQGIMMTGQGQRLPAGEARRIKVEEQLSWQDPREWRFNTNAELKQTSAKVDKSLFKLKQQLQELNDASQKIHRQLKHANQHTFDELESTLLSLERLMQATPFSLQMTSVMAQANVTRSQVSSLLC